MADRQGEATVGDNGRLRLWVLFCDRSEYYDEKWQPSSVECSEEFTVRSDFDTVVVSVETL